MSDFISRVAVTAVQDWKERKIMLPSVVIAQAILESGWGKSELALNANALFGIKKHDWTGATYTKDATEQKANGDYYTVYDTEWRAYSSWEESIIDHNDYILTRKREDGSLRYAEIVGNTDREAVCRLLQECGYATSLTYPEKLLRLITQNNLAQYDEVENVVKIALDAGHGQYTAGKRCLKSIDAKETREWFLNDRIADRLEELLADYKCSIIRTDDTTGAVDVTLSERVAKANEAGADLFLSIHHNAGINGGTGGGTQVYYCSTAKERKTQAQALYNAVTGKTGLVGNRHDKVIKKAYYVVKNTTMPAFLLENGFMDSSTDTPVILTKAHAEKTAQGLLEFLVSVLGLEGKTKDSIRYKVQCGAFTEKENAVALVDKLEKAGFEAVIVNVEQ